MKQTLLKRKRSHRCVFLYILPLTFKAGIPEYVADSGQVHKPVTSLQRVQINVFMFVSGCIIKLHIAMRRYFITPVFGALAFVPIYT